jgi:hypothetical protein
MGQFAILINQQVRHYFADEVKTMGSLREQKNSFK